jgi:hypothetical protein
MPRFFITLIKKRTTKLTMTNDNNLKIKLVFAPSFSERHKAEYKNINSSDNPQNYIQYSSSSVFLYSNSFQ